MKILAKVLLICALLCASTITEAVKTNRVLASSTISGTIQLLNTEAWINVSVDDPKVDSPKLLKAKTSVRNAREAYKTSLKALKEAPNKTFETEKDVYEKKLANLDVTAMAMRTQLSADKDAADKDLAKKTQAKASTADIKKAESVVNNRTTALTSLGSDVDFRDDLAKIASTDADKVLAYKKLNNAQLKKSNDGNATLVTSSKTALKSAEEKLASSEKAANAEPKNEKKKITRYQK